MAAVEVGSKDAVEGEGLEAPCIGVRLAAHSGSLCTEAACIEERWAEHRERSGYSEAPDTAGGPWLPCRDSRRKCPQGIAAMVASLA